jgi:hypothetical protein
MSFKDLLLGFKSAVRGDVKSGDQAVPSAPNYRPAAYQHPLLAKLTSIAADKRAAATAPTSPSSADRANIHIGILLIIIDDLPHEAIWRLWAKYAQAPVSQQQIKVSFWIHAKFPDRIISGWARSHLVETFQFRPAWASLEIAKVMAGLLKEVNTHC